MQVDFQTQPSFGMARLTSQGEKLAKKFVGEIATFSDETVYTRNVLRSKLTKTSFGPDEIKDFFTQGTTPFAKQNAKFIKKQISGPFSIRSIQKYLAKDQKISGSGLSEKGEALVGSILEVFDNNIGNPAVSSKTGRKMLDAIKKFSDVDKIAERIAVVSEKLFSK